MAERDRYQNQDDDKEEGQKRSRYSGGSERKYFITRHSIKPTANDKESEKYKGLSHKGVDLARVRAKDIIQDMEEAEAGTVMFLGGLQMK